MSEQQPTEVYFPSIKVKHIRCVTPDMENAIRSFLQELPQATQIVEISQAGNFTETSLMSVIIIYLN